MIFTNMGNQYLFGTRYKTKTDIQGDKIKYEILSYPKKSFGELINNLILTQGTLTIKTNWDIGWQPKQYFVDNYGKRYIINDIQIMPQEVNPQVLAVAMVNPDTDFVLNLTQVDNVWGLK